MPNRRDLFTLAALAPLARAGQLPDVTLSPDQAKLKREPFGEHRVYFEGATGQVRSMTAGRLILNAGASPHPPHEHPEEEFLLVTEGAGEISIGGQAVKVGPGSMMYCGANKVHGIVNTGRGKMTFFYYKWQV